MNINQRKPSSRQDSALAIIKLNYLLSLNNPDTQKNQVYYYSALASCYRDQNELQTAQLHARLAITIREERYNKTPTSDNLKLLTNVRDKLTAINLLLANLP